MKNRNYGRLLWMITVVVCSLVGIAYAVRPSGPGQTTATNSLSVAIASDQVVTTVPNKLTAVTPSDSTNTTTYCDRGVFVGHDAGISNVQLLAAVETDAAAAVTFKYVPNGTFIPGQFSRVMGDATTSNAVICLGH